MSEAKTDTKRPGEISVDRDVADLNDAAIVFVGRIRTAWKEGDCPKNLVQARVRNQPAWLEVSPEFRPGLAGLVAGKPIIIQYWMHQSRRDLIVQSPGHVEGPRGVFSIRSPVRPNPIALATVKIVEVDVEQGTVRIDAIDCFDETPLLDIKPWLDTIDRPDVG